MTNYRIRNGYDLLLPDSERDGAEVECPVCDEPFAVTDWIDAGGCSRRSERYACPNDCDGVITILQ